MLRGVNIHKLPVEDRKLRKKRKQSKIFCQTVRVANGSLSWYGDGGHSGSIFGFFVCGSYISWYVFLLFIHFYYQICCSLHSNNLQQHYQEMNNFNCATMRATTQAKQQNDEDWKKTKIVTKWVCLTCKRFFWFLLFVARCCLFGWPDQARPVVAQLALDHIIQSMQPERVYVL